MATFNKTTQKLLARLFDGMRSGTSKRVDNAPGTYMALHCERLTVDRFSLSHYYEQNGDLVPDPDMELYRDADGSFWPVSMTMAIGTHTRAIEFGPDGKPCGTYPRTLRDFVAFGNMWARNIRQQQFTR